MSKKIFLSGDRPTGPMHLGHLFGTLLARVEMQEEFESYVMVADTQALTDNYDDVKKVRTNIHEVVCDYLAVGIDPDKSHIFVQSLVRELPELAMYFLNMVTINRIGHNPTVKSEVKQRGFGEGVPAGFYLYPLYQVADITLFKASHVPVGIDQMPMLELSRDVVRRFNEIYGSDVLIVPEGIYPEGKVTLPGHDGQKMSKSLGNTIDLSSTADQIVRAVKKMKSDPNRTSIESPGDPDQAVAFSYLDCFDSDKKAVEDLKEQYRAGGMMDKVVKERLTDVLVELLGPIAKRRKEFHCDPDGVNRIIEKGTIAAREKAHSTMQDVRKAMGIDYPICKE